jgi:hypothetical protein
MVRCSVGRVSFAECRAALDVALVRAVLFRLLRQRESVVALGSPGDHVVFHASPASPASVLICR